MGIEVAANLTNEFADGVWLFELAAVSDPAAAAPSGVVTFLFTDVEGSTRRW